jgi:class 3 adenylate cyclase
MRPSFPRLLAAVTLFSLPLLILFFGWNQDRIMNARAVTKDYRSELSRHFRLLEAFGTFELQVMAGIDSFQHLSRPNTLFSEAHAKETFHRTLGQWLPRYDFMVLNPEGKDYRLLLRESHHLDFGPALPEMLRYLASFYRKPKSTARYSSLSPRELKELAKSLRTHLKTSVWIDPGDNIHGKFIVLHDLARPLAFVWKMAPDGTCVLLLLEIPAQAGRMTAEQQAAQWKHPAIDLAFLPENPQDGQPLYSRSFRSRAQIEHLPTRGLPVQPSGERTTDDALIQWRPPRTGFPFRTVLIYHFPESLLRAPKAGGGLPMLLFFLLIIGTWSSVERFVFGRRPAFLVRSTLLFSFFFIGIIPFSGTVFFVNRLIQEENDVAREEIRESLRRELSRADNGYRLFSASVTRVLRKFPHSPSLSPHLERLGNDPSEKNQVTFFQTIQKEIRDSLPFIHRMALLGPNDVFQTWEAGEFMIYAGRQSNIGDALFHQMLRETYSDLGGEVAQAAVTNGLESESSRSVRKNLELDTARQMISGMLGPTAYLELNLFRDRIGKLKSQSDWIYLIDVPFFVQNRILAVLKVYFGSLRTEPTYLHQALFKRNENDHAAGHFLAIPGFRAPAFKPVPVNCDAEKVPGLLELSHQAFFQRIGIQAGEKESPDRWQMEVFVPRHLRYLLSGATATAPLDRASDRAAVQGFLFIAGCLTGALILGAFSAWIFLRPLQSILHGVQEVSRNNFRIHLPPTTNDEFGRLAGTFNIMVKGLREGKILAKFVSGSVQRFVQGKTEGGQTADAELCTVTILFSTVVISEHFSRHSLLLDKLNRHLSCAEEACRLFGGEIDKILGDKILMVFYHRDFPTSLDAGKAVAQAISHLRTRLSPSQGSTDRHFLGVNTGEVVAGVLGASSVSLDHTVIGDPVNLAARLLDLAKKTGARTVLSETTLDLFPRRPKVDRLSQTKVKGKTREITAFQLDETQVDPFAGVFTDHSV